MEGPVLGIADVTRPFEVETDESDFVLGGVLLQDGHLIAYETIKENLQNDPAAQAIIQLANEGKTRQFWVENDILFTKESNLNISSSYHPQTNGQTKRFNSVLEEYLRHFIDARQKNWIQMLDVAQLCFNCQKSTTTGRTPFEIVCGRQPVLPHVVDHPYVGKSPQAYNFTKEWCQSIEVAQAYLEKASKHMKKWADKKRRPLEFQAGYQVLVKLRPEQLRFQVIHVSNLKPYHQDTVDPTRNEITRPAIMLTNKVDKEVESILAERTRRVESPRRDIQEFLVKWKGLPDEEIRWEHTEDLKTTVAAIEEFEQRRLTGTSTI
ncbi:uncharacterized protein LOC111017468 [Momordica charantia]|uniref:Uncharacterized protein LOC111017468 n=1 Tax=Momordica charantia TaxID=3673 RepID=A0A6J1D5E5_MOMCH|nr:uncharacterized protein LOC111017468 [Momordica charantia]